MIFTHMEKEKSNHIAKNAINYGLERDISLIKSIMIKKIEKQGQGTRILLNRFY